MPGWHAITNDDEEAGIARDPPTPATAMPGRHATGWRTTTPDEITEVVPLSPPPAPSQPVADALTQVTDSLAVPSELLQPGAGAASADERVVKTAAALEQIMGIWCGGSGNAASLTRLADKIGVKMTEALAEELVVQEEASRILDAAHDLEKYIEDPEFERDDGIISP